MIIDPVKLMPPELVPYAEDLQEFKEATNVRLFFPPVGIGGGGTVLAAENALGKSLAVKIIIAEDDATRDQALREASILKQVQHVAALSGPGLLWRKHYPDVDLFFLAMDLVRGQTLAEYLAAHGPLDEALALEWTIALAEALEALHRQKIIHRDVKPDNIMLLAMGQRYQPIVVDYGIAKVGNHTARGARAATDGYAPPEQYKGSTDRRSDVYALGATLYEMLTGQTPPKATRRSPTTPLEPRQITPSITLELELVVQIATACVPDRRFPGMGAMLDALRLVQSGDKVALLAILQAMGLVTASSTGLLPASTAANLSVPQLPPLPMKKTPPAGSPSPQGGSMPTQADESSVIPLPARPSHVTPQLASAGSQEVLCPYCGASCPAGALFCDVCGAAATAAPLMSASRAGKVIPTQAPHPGFCTPGPQFLSLLLGRQIVLGGPALANWEKALLVMAYWLLLASLALGGRALSLTFSPANGLATGCLLLFLLLFPLFAKIVLGWKGVVMTRHGQASGWRRNLQMLVSLAAIVGVLAWALREVLAGWNLWASGGVSLSLVMYICLAVFALLLIKALLA